MAIRRRSLSFRRRKAYGGQDGGHDGATSVGHGLGRRGAVPVFFAGGDFRGQMSEGRGQWTEGG